jgi:hypothetical protein
MTTGVNAADLDFDSVQRGNAEIERRAQEVIDRCWQMGERNPILSIHDVGAGGLSNALPELVHGGGAGGAFDLAAIPSLESGMSPREIWCNEAQERYVLALCARRARGVRRDLQARALPVRGRRPRARRRSPRRRGSALRQHAGRRAARRDPRQRAAHDAKRAAGRASPQAPRFRRVVARGGRAPGAALPGRRGQDLPDHDRRPHGRRPVLARPDGRALAGPRRRRRR